MKLGAIITGDIIDSTGLTSEEMETMLRFKSEKYNNA